MQDPPDWMRRGAETTSRLGCGKQR